MKNSKIANFRNSKVILLFNLVGNGHNKEEVEKVDKHWEQKLSNMTQQMEQLNHKIFQQREENRDLKQQCERQ